VMASMNVLMELLHVIFQIVVRKLQEVRMIWHVTMMNHPYNLEYHQHNLKDHM
jgi:hypothetical protein